MPSRLFGKTALLVAVVVGAAMTVDWLVSAVLMAGQDGFVYTPLNTLVISLAVGIPVCWYVTRQRLMLQEMKDDLSEARDAAEAASEAKSAFLATMSHEIRTPLNGVLGMTQAMAMSELSDPQRERLDVVRESAVALLALLNDVLDLSKIEAGKLDLEEIEFDLGEMMRGAHQAFTALANKKGLSFGLDTIAAEGVYLGDPTRVRQILYNLLSNAVKFTEQGEIRVEAGLGPSGLWITVTDTGPGIAADKVELLFAKFTQADASTTRRYGGTGLGLSICRQLAELMGGDIVVESEVGRGTRFTVSLPLPRVDEPRGPAVLAPSVLTAIDRPLKVLAAEDNTVNQLVLKTLLHHVGVSPVVVADGAAALQAWEAEAWDLVLMDVQMPVLDGVTAARTIRARERETGRPRTPVFALSANAMSHQVASYLDAGMDGHLAKPIEIARLFDVIDAIARAEAVAPLRRAVG